MNRPNKPRLLEWLLFITLAPIVYLIVFPIMVIAIMVCCDWVGEDPRE